MRQVCFTLLILLSVCSHSQADSQASLSGRVFDAEGKAGFQMEVRVMKADAVEANPESIFAENRIYVYVDQDGSYSLMRVSAGVVF